MVLGFLMFSFIWRFPVSEDGRGETAKFQGPIPRRNIPVCGSHCNMWPGDYAIFAAREAESKSPTMCRLRLFMNYFPMT